MKINRRHVLIAAGGSASVAVLGVGAWTLASHSGSAAGTAVDAGPFGLTLTPSNGTETVGVVSSVVATVISGTLTAVTLTDTHGKHVAGAFTANNASWSPTEPLGYNKKYTLTATATDHSGHTAEATSTFVTLQPAKQTLATIKPGGGRVGVGQPIVVTFDESIPDRVAATNALQVVTAPAVEGAWRWISGSEVHWRPKTAPGTYWTPGTKVTVTAKIYGANLGGGLYGQTDSTVNFTIDRSRIAIADYNTKHMQVFIDGALVRTIPVSLGMGGSTTGTDGQRIYLWTLGGPHVVLDKQPQVRMSSATFGIGKGSPLYYDTIVRLCVHTSYSGEYVHLADWNIPQQGHVNTSHGCVNVGPANMQWFYDTFQVGDIVDVRNSPRTLPLTDGYGDWTLTWEQWTAGDPSATPSPAIATPSPVPTEAR